MLNCKTHDSGYWQCFFKVISVSTFSSKQNSMLKFGFSSFINFILGGGGYGHTPTSFSGVGTDKSTCCRFQYHSLTYFSVLPAVGLIHYFLQILMS